MDIWILKYQKCTNYGYMDIKISKSVKIVEEKNVSNVQTKHSPHSKNSKFKI